MSDGFAERIPGWFLVSMVGETPFHFMGTIPPGSLCCKRLQERIFYGSKMDWLDAYSIKLVDIPEPTKEDIELRDEVEAVHKDHVLKSKRQRMLREHTELEERDPIAYSHKVWNELPCPGSNAYPVFTGSVMYRERDVLLLLTTEEQMQIEMWMKGIV